MSKHSLEIKFEIWNDKSGERFVIGDDRDGIGLIEIRYVDDTGKTSPGAGIILSEEVAVLLVKSLNNILEFRKKSKEESKDDK